MAGEAAGGSRLRLAFMGTPDFAVPAFDALRAAGHEIAVVFTRAPKPAGRGRTLQKTPVHRAAESRDIPVQTPERLGEESHVSLLAGCDAAVVAAYGLLLPATVLAAPRLGCFNVHASLLPRWRGAAPIQYCIMAGDRETGVSIMQMDAGLDTGAVVRSERIELPDTITGGKLHDRLARLGARLVCQALDGVAAGRDTPVPQPPSGITHAPRLTPRDGRLDWSRPAGELERKVRALDPWPGAWCTLDGERLKVLEAQVVTTGRTDRPGTVIDRSLAVACGDQAIRLLRVCRPGRRAVAVPDFLRGRTVEPGSVLD